jgi:tetratricopeptide (TPR) repeat protein
MHAERDYLSAHVFPRLEERLRQRRHQLEPIDLRLGIETVDEETQEQRELLVLKVCLEEVQRSRPFLLVLLGDRFGTVLPQERMETAIREIGFQADVRHKSVTALEIEYGIFKEHPEQRARSFFYFREPLPLEQMTPELAELYSDARSPDPEIRANHERLLALKQAIRFNPDLAPQVHSYSAGWDTAAQRITGLEAFGEMVAEHLWGALEEETSDWSHQPPQSLDQQERAALQEFVDQRRRDFTGRLGLLGRLGAMARGGGNGCWAACLTGAPGTGKSAVMAELHHRLSGEPGVLLLANAAGGTPRGAQVEVMLRRFIAELATALGLQSDPLPERSSSKQLDDIFATLLGQAAKQRSVVVLLDAIDQFEATSRASHLTWLPPPQRWPAGARLIATGIAGTATGALGQRSGVDTIPLLPLEPADGVEIARRVWARYHRQVNPEVLHVLAGKRLADGSAAAGNPLWLTLALEQINLLDADDFARADRDYGHISGGGERLRALLVGIAQRMPPEVPALYGWLLEQTEKTYGAERARAFAVLIALSRNGWRERDLFALMKHLPGTSELALANLRRGFRANVAWRGSAGQLDFFHNQMREAVRNRALGDAATEREWHRSMADHLEALPLDDPLRISELMVHLIAADEPLRAAQLLGSNSSLFQSLGGVEGAVDAVARHLVDGENKKPNSQLQWVCGLLRHHDLADDEVARLAQRFLFDVLDVVHDSTRLSTRKQLAETAMQSLVRLVQIDPANTEWQRDLSVSHNKIGDVLVSQGDGPGALAAYQAGLTTAEGLEKRDPANTQWQRVLSASKIRIGDVLVTQGDGPGALAAYQAGLTIAEGLAKRDPANTQWQHDLLISQSKVTDLLMAQGDAPALLKSYQALLASHEGFAERDPGMTQWQRNLSVTYERIGDALVALGDGPRSLAAYQAALTIAQGVSMRDPANTSWQRDLSMSHFKMGDVLRAQGDWPGALGAYQAALSIAEDLAKRDPSNTQWQRDHLISQLSVADTLMNQGDGPAGLKAHQAGLRVAEGLLKRDPTNTQWRKDLSISYERIGNILMMMGDVDGALAAYQMRLGIMGSLTKRDPVNTEWQRDLSVSHIKIGDVLVAQGDGLGAMAAYQAARAIDEGMAQHDPANTQWQKGLSISHERIGNVLMMMGDVDGALTAYQMKLKIMGALTKRDPANAEWQRDLSVSHNKIGNVLLSQGDGPGAMEAYQAGLTIREGLAKRNPANNVWQRDLSVSHGKIGNVLLSQGDGPEAMAAYQAGLTIAEGLAKRDLANTEWQRDLSVSHNKMGDVLASQGHWPGALAAYQAGLTIAEGLAKRDPANTQWQRDLYISQSKVADALMGQGNVPAAVEAFQAVLATNEALAKRDPANMQWQHDLFVSKAKIGDVLVSQGDGPGALVAYQAALTICECLARRDPANTQWQADLVESRVKLGRLNSLLSFQKQWELLCRGTKLLNLLKQVDRLHAKQNLTVLYNNALRPEIWHLLWEWMRPLIRRR